VQRITEEAGGEITSRGLWDAFRREYLDRRAPIALLSHAASGGDGDRVGMEFEVEIDGNEKSIRGHGNGPIACFVDALRRGAGIAIHVRDYSEHAAGEGADATAVAYVEGADARGARRFGVGRHASLVTASLEAVVSAANRLLRAGPDN